MDTNPPATKHYLYGRKCLGEHVDADEPAEEEWRYYQRDAKNMVRQTSAENRQVTMAWTYSPTGGVVLGEGGPVTNLDCGNGGIYDWSTGLIFRNGRYFDPSTGIWITMGAIVTWQIWPKENRRQRRSRRKTKTKPNLLFLFLILILLALALAGCNEPDPCPITPTPGTPTGPPTLPPTDTSVPPTDTPQPSPTDTPQPPPTDTQEPPPTDTPEPPLPELPTPTTPSSRSADQWKITHEELMVYGFDWFEYFLRNPEETEAVVMARVGIGEGREDNILDQDLVMWTLKTRKIIGFTKPGYPATINSVVTRSNEQYHVIGILAGVFGGDPYTDPAGYAAADLSRCTQNVMRMIFPCGPKEQEYLDDLDRAYNQAQIILATDIHDMPPGLKYFESFVGEGASEGTWCPWGDTDRSRLRPSENLAGSTVFFDCLLLDNQMIWGQE